MISESFFQYRNFLLLLADFSKGSSYQIPWEDQYLVISKTKSPQGMILKMVVVPFEEMTNNVRSFFQSSSHIRFEANGPELFYDKTTECVYLIYQLYNPLSYLHLKKALVEFEISLKQWKEIFLC